MHPRRLYPPESPSQGLLLCHPVKLMQSAMFRLPRVPLEFSLKLLEDEYISIFMSFKNTIYVFTEKKMSVDLFF